MSRTSLFSFLCFAIGWYIAIVSTAYADDKPNSIELLIAVGEPVKVVEVSSFGLLIFEDEYYIRLWGVLPDADALRRLILGRSVKCTIPSKITQMNRLSYVAHCIFSDQGNSSELAESPAEILINSGSAVELCAESFGAFGTCEE